MLRFRNVAFAQAALAGAAYAQDQNVGICNLKNDAVDTAAACFEGGFAEGSAEAVRFGRFTKQFGCLGYPIRGLVK
jgi:hypothetical protein